MKIKQLKTSHILLKMKREPKHLAYWLCRMPNIEAARECIKEISLYEPKTLYFLNVGDMFIWNNTFKGHYYWSEIDYKTRI